MSLSQKHSGKVLVPWFNIAEWKAVYDLIYTETAKDWPKALEIFKIWKLRTPLLSAGVEGTLIVLEALLVNTEQLSSFESTHIFSTSLVRFLNLCGANNDKQGTFYKTAMKNELPKWLVSVRHDIAHSHKVPSQSMLELSLKFCLDWLKGKYWDVQYECMSDFVVNKEADTVVEDVVYFYKQLKDSTVIQSNKKVGKCINRLIGSTWKQMSSEEVVENVNNVLKEAIKRNKDDSAEKLCSLLIDDLAILSTECEICKTGKQAIPAAFMKKWTSLLNIMHETEVMPNFIRKLFQFLYDNKHDLCYQEVASLWIKAIFMALNNQEKKHKGQNGLRFNNTNNCLKMRAFATEILKKVTPLTLNFVEEVLRYNDAPPEFIDDSLKLISAFSTNNIAATDKILTVADLNFNFNNFHIDAFQNEPSTPSRSRWILIEDTSPFMNLPLGILPHQNRNKNPLIEL